MNFVLQLSHELGTLVASKLQGSFVGTSPIANSVFSLQHPFLPSWDRENHFEKMFLIRVISTFATSFHSKLEISYGQMLENQQPQKLFFMPRYVDVRFFMSIKRDKRQLCTVSHHFPDTKHQYDDLAQRLRTL